MSIAATLMVLGMPARPDPGAHLMDHLGRFGGNAGPSPAPTHQGGGLPAERVPRPAPSTSGSIGIVASAHPFLPMARRALTVGAVALLWSSTSTSPALAHEFSIALVTAAGSRSSPDAAEVRAGWRLAVDQSPDVSHPAGSDAGDHLGGIDVRVTAATRRPQAPGFAPSFEMG